MILWMPVTSTLFFHVTAYDQTPAKRLIHHPHLALFSKLELSTELGLLDISFYRDDFSQSGLHPQVKSSKLPDIEGKTIILVYDVIMSGRTIRAAMNELFDYGRPEKIVLACLLDVGHRELPIQADIIGQAIDRPSNQRIKLSGPEPLTLTTVTLNK